MYRRPTLDSLNRVPGRWLGPANYTLPWAIPYRAIGPFFAIWFASLAMLSLLGAHGLWRLLIATALALILAYVLTTATGPDRPVPAIVSTLLHEASAPRPATPPSQSATLRPTELRAHADRQPSSQEARK